MKTTLFTLLLIISFAASANKDAKIGKILELSGVAKQTRQIEKTMAHQITLSVKNNQNLTAEQKTELVKRNDKNRIRAEKVLGQLKQKMAKQFKEKQLDNLIAFYKDSFIKKFTKKELEAGDVKNQKAMMKFAGELKANPPKPGDKRVALIQKLDQATNQSDFSTSVFLEVFETLTKSINGMAMSAKQKEAVESRLKMLKEQFKRQIKDTTLIAMLYIYKDFKTNDLNKYVDRVAKNANLKKLASLHLGQIKGELVAWGENFYKSFNDVVLSKKKKKK